MAEKALLIRLHSLGDVVLASGTARALSAGYSTTFATRPEYVPVARRFPGNLRVYPVSNPRDLRALSGEHRLIVDLQGNAGTFLALAGRRLRRYSFDRAKRKRILSGSGERMEWRARGYLAAAGLTGDCRPVLSRESCPPDDRLVVGIVAGGRWPMKAIPPGVVAELARLFADVHSATVVLLGSGSDRELAEEIAEECGSRDVRPVAGEGGIESLIRRIEGLNLLITPDSGPAHLGIALGVPTQVIFTATSPALGFYDEGFDGAFLAEGVPCRPCHRHGGKSCRAGDEKCRRTLIPRMIFEEARCLIR